MHASELVPYCKHCENAVAEKYIETPFHYIAKCPRWERVRYRLFRPEVALSVLGREPPSTLKFMRATSHAERVCNALEWAAAL